MKGPPHIVIFLLPSPQQQHNIFSPGAASAEKASRQAARNTFHPKTALFKQPLKNVGYRRLWYVLNFSFSLVKLFYEK